MSDIHINKLIDHIQAINLRKIEDIFFILFLLSIPIQTRLTFITPQSYLSGNFNEYVTIFIYLSDILFIITLFLFFVNSVSFNTIFTKLRRHINNSPHLIPTFTLIITLITWFFLAIIWAEYKNLAIYQFIKTFEFLLIFLYIYIRLPGFGFNKFAFIIFITGFIQSIIGIAQYILQRSLNLKFLMESTLSSELPNVAKILIDGKKIIRAYGTFPHPNIFSGFLLFSIFCGVYLLFLRKQFQPYRIVSRETILYLAILIGILYQATALILTFSRTSWMTAILIPFIFIFIAVESKLFHVKQFSNTLFSQLTKTILLSLIIPFTIIIAINWKQINNRTTNENQQYYEAVDNRTLYNNIAIAVVKQYPLIGMGGKSFTIKMQHFNDNKLEPWQFQPVHNIYLLIVCEFGFIGLILFLLLLYETIKYPCTKINSIIVSRETIILHIALASILLGFLFIGMFDHYFWTLQQGQLTLWIVLGAILSLKRYLQPKTAIKESQVIIKTTFTI